MNLIYPTMTMTTLLDVAYYEWLISQIEIPNDKTYRDLFEEMHNVEFVWFIPNDDNRVQDALDLRTEFKDGKKVNLNLEGSTMLEVLISLSRRVAFTAGGDSRKWAWRLIKNLKLNKKSDPLSRLERLKVNDILYAVVWRTYQRNGQGGFFPLNHSLKDQTKIEIWYQMNEYVIEGHPL